MLAFTAESHHIKLVYVQVFKCHRITMASVSTLIRTQLMSESQTNGVSVVTLDEKRVNPRIFQWLLELIYEGKDIVHDSDGALLNIMVAVTYLKIPTLEWRFLHLLCAKLTERCV